MSKLGKKTWFLLGVFAACMTGGISWAETDVQQVEKAFEITLSDDNRTQLADALTRAREGQSEIDMEIGWLDVVRVISTLDLIYTEAKDGALHVFVMPAQVTDIPAEGTLKVLACRDFLGREVISEDKVKATEITYAFAFENEHGRQQPAIEYTVPKSLRQEHQDGLFLVFTFEGVTGGRSMTIIPFAPQFLKGQADPIDDRFFTEDEIPFENEHPTIAQNQPHPLSEPEVPPPALRPETARLPAIDQALGRAPSSNGVIEQQGLDMSITRNTRAQADTGTLRSVPAVPYTPPGGTTLDQEKSKRRERMQTFQAKAGELAPQP